MNTLLLYGILVTEILNSSLCLRKTNLLLARCLIVLHAVTFSSLASRPQPIHLQASEPKIDSFFYTKPVAVQRMDANA